LLIDRYRKPEKSHSLEVLMKRSLLLLTGALVVAGLVAGANFLAAAPPDLTKVMPTADALSGFENYQLSRPNRPSGPITVNLHARRRVDGASFQMSGGTFPSAKDALAYMARSRTLVMSPQNWRQGTPSGKKIGDDAWSFGEREGERPKGGLSMQLRSGRSVMNVSLSIPPVQGKGRLLLKPEDVRLVEAQAEQCIQRIREMGL
jgi:hypothetical protein